MQTNGENTDCPGPMSEEDKQAIKAIPASMFEPKRTTIADEVAAKAKRVFELMDSQDGNKAFGSVMGTDILITIERVKTDRPSWWPADWEWPPTLSDAEALRAVADGIPTTPEAVAAEELRQQREDTFELPESLRDASKVLERIKYTGAMPNIGQGRNLSEEERRMNQRWENISRSCQ